MAKYVFIKYNFLFDPSNTWSHLSQFENDLAEFFSANGFEAEIVKGVSGQVGERILLIKRVDNMLKIGTSINQDVKSPKEQFAKVNKKISKKK